MKQERLFYTRRIANPQPVSMNHYWANTFMLIRIFFSASSEVVNNFRVKKILKYWRLLYEKTINYKIILHKPPRPAIWKINKRYTATAKLDEHCFFVYTKKNNQMIYF